MNFSVIARFILSKPVHILAVGVAVAIPAMFGAAGDQVPALVSTGCTLVTSGVMAHAIASFLDNSPTNPPVTLKEPTTHVQ